MLHFCDTPQKLVAGIQEWDCFVNEEDRFGEGEFTYNSKAVHPWAFYSVLPHMQRQSLLANWWNLPSIAPHLSPPTTSSVSTCEHTRDTYKHSCPIKCNFTYLLEYGSVLISINIWRASYFEQSNLCVFLRNNKMPPDILVPWLLQCIFQ